MNAASFPRLKVFFPLVLVLVLSACGYGRYASSFQPRGGFAYDFNNQVFVGIPDDVRGLREGETPILEFVDPVNLAEVTERAVDSGYVVAGKSSFQGETLTTSEIARNVADFAKHIGATYVIVLSPQFVRSEISAGLRPETLFSKSKTDLISDNDFWRRSVADRNRITEKTETERQVLVPYIENLEIYAQGAIYFFTRVR